MRLSHRKKRLSKCGLYWPNVNKIRTESHYTWLKYMRNLSMTWMLFDGRVKSQENSVKNSDLSQSSKSLFSKIKTFFRNKNTT